MGYSLSFSKAVMVVILISDKIEQGMYDYISAKMLSEQLNIARPTLVKILQDLTGAGIVETKEGKTGGIRMAQNPKKLTVLDVLNATEREKRLFNTSFDLNAKGKRPDTAQKAVTEILRNAEAQMKEALKKRTISAILKDMSR